MNKTPGFLSSMNKSWLLFPSAVEVSFPPVPSCSLYPRRLLFPYLRCISSCNVQWHTNHHVVMSDAVSPSSVFRPIQMASNSQWCWCNDEHYMYKFIIWIVFYIHGKARACQLTHREHHRLLHAAVPYSICPWLYVCCHCWKDGGFPKCYFPVTFDSKADVKGFAQLYF